MASRSHSWPNPSTSVQVNPPMPTRPATRPTTWQSLLARSWCVGSSDHVATQSILLECGPCAPTFSYARKSSNPSWLVSPALIADRRKIIAPLDQHYLKLRQELHQTFETIGFAAA